MAWGRRRCVILLSSHAHSVKLFQSLCREFEVNIFCGISLSSNWNMRKWTTLAFVQSFLSAMFKFSIPPLHRSVSCVTLLSCCLHVLLSISEVSFWKVKPSNFCKTFNLTFTECCTCSSSTTSTHLPSSLSLFSVSLSLSLLGQVIRVMMRNSLWSVAQYQSVKRLAARYLYNRIKSALTVCQLSWGIQFVMIVNNNAEDITIFRWLGSRMLLKGEWAVVCVCVCARAFFLLSLSFSLSSHKSNLLNSCLRSEIILRLFFTVAAQWWICKRLLSFYFLWGVPA